MSHHIRRTSKHLSWLLRHGANQTGLTMDAAGWAAVDDVLQHARISLETLEEVVRLNNKQRLQLEGGRIRCTQGHSVDGTPVTLDGLEASWTVWTASSPIWHGTRIEFIESIMETGIQPQARTHVHLAESLESTVGKRSQVAVMLEIDPVRLRAAGQTIYASPNGVILVRQVPAHSITGFRAMTKRARQQAAHIQTLIATGASAP